MANGFKHGAGGVDPLNFKVVGGAMPFGYVDCRDFKITGPNVTTITEKKRISVTTKAVAYQAVSYEIPVYPGQTIVFTAEVESGYTGVPRIGLKTYSNGAFSESLKANSANIVSGKISISYTVPSGVERLLFALFANWSEAAAGTVTYKNVMMGSSTVNARENMVWVDTDAKVSDWIFSAEQPTGIAGLVWFMTPSPNTVAFNALKKNSLMVYPNAAKQYVSGAWSDIEAYVYVEGVWKVMDDTFWLYKEGTEFPARTGDLVYVKIPDSNGNNGEPTVTRNSDNLVITGAQSGGARFYAKKINLTDFNKLCFEGTMNTNLYDSLRLKLGVWTSTTGNPVASKVGQHINGTTLEISVANLSGEHYVGFWIMDTNSKITVKKLWLE